MTESRIPDGVDVGALADIAEQIGRRAAELAARRRAAGVAVADRKSSLVDVVTAADREVEDLIRTELARLRPEDAFFGEESGAASGTSGLTWVVDPIDGTVNYLYGSPEYGVSIAVVAGEPDPMTWTPLAGVVVQPATGRVLRAEAGRASTADGVALRVTEPASLAETLLATGFGYTADRRRSQIAVLDDVIVRVRDIRRGGAASLDLCAVGTGVVDAYYERGINPWDMAAGAMVAAGAGARVVTWESAGARSYLVAARRIAAELEPILRGAERRVLGD